MVSFNYSLFYELENPADQASILCDILSYFLDLAKLELILPPPIPS
jgi:hypothetical protein